MCLVTSALTEKVRDIGRKHGGLTRELANDPDQEHCLPRAGRTFDPQQSRCWLDRFVNAPIGECCVLIRIKNPLVRIVEQFFLLLLLNEIHIILGIHHEEGPEAFCVLVIYSYVLLLGHEISEVLMNAIKQRLHFFLPESTSWRRELFSYCR